MIIEESRRLGNKAAIATSFTSVLLRCICFYLLKNFDNTNVVSYEMRYFRMRSRLGTNVVLINPTFQYGTKLDV